VGRPARRLCRRAALSASNRPGASCPCGRRGQCRGARSCTGGHPPTRSSCCTAPRRTRRHRHEQGAEPRGGCAGVHVAPTGHDDGDEGGRAGRLVFGRGLHARGGTGLRPNVGWTEGQQEDRGEGKRAHGRRETTRRREGPPFQEQTRSRTAATVWRGRKNTRSSQGREGAQSRGAAEERPSFEGASWPAGRRQDAIAVQNSRAGFDRMGRRLR
jgi:hypothetical protein